MSYIQRLISQTLDGDGVMHGLGASSPNMAIAAKIIKDLATNQKHIVDIPDVVCEMCGEPNNGGARCPTCERDGWYDDSTRDQFI